MSRYDGRLAGFGFAQCLLSEKQAEAPLFFDPAMAGDAIFIEDGFDLRAVIDLLSRTRQVIPGNPRDTYSQKK